MKQLAWVITLVSAVGLLAAGFADPAVPTRASDNVKYSVKVHEFEGCECNSVCPCVFSSDTTFGNCRGILVYTFTEGTYGTTKLKDVSCVVALTWSGKNMEANVGKFKGVLYMPDSATPAELEAMAGLLDAMFGDAFASLEQRSAPISITRQGDVHDLTVGTVARLRIHAVKDKNGQITKVLNAPSPFAYPEMTCALAEVHTYDDGTSSWSFTGRNGFFSDFELSNED